MHYHLNINLPFAFHPHHFSDVKGFCELPHPVDETNKEMLIWLRERQLTTRVIRYFQSVPFQSYPLHWDGFGAMKDIPKINIVRESNDCVMSWYKIKEGKKARRVINLVNETIDNIDKEDCDLLYSTDCNTDCLINGGIIHDLRNGSNNNKIRKCYSIFLTDINTGKQATWNHALRMLDDVLE